MTKQERISRIVSVGSIDLELLKQLIGLYYEVSEFITEFKEIKSIDKLWGKIKFAIRHLKDISKFVVRIESIILSIKDLLVKEEEFENKEIVKVFIKEDVKEED